MKIVFIFLLLFSFNTMAHKASDSYLTIKNEEDKVFVQWDIAIRDLENVMVLDNDGDGNISWGEIEFNRGKIFSFITSQLILKNESGPCYLNSNSLQIDHHSDGVYVVLFFDSNCDASKKINVEYSLFFDVDAQHRGLLSLIANDRKTSYVFAPENRQYSYSRNSNSQWRSFSAFFKEGVWHIWVGFDHVLFLMSLLLPSVLIRQNGYWQAAGCFKEVLIDVAKIVTAFTFAHSLTLSLVILMNVTLPVAIVESVIAISVIAVAVNNNYPFMHARRWAMGLGFGLIHGFGFANVLTELQLSDSALLVSLLGFNFGVETGQLALVLAFLPGAFLLRHGWLYQNMALKVGSIVIASFGLLWLVERST